MSRRVPFGVAEVHETKLPGVGLRFDFVTGSGTPVGVLVHRTGRRDVLVYSRDDASSCEATIQLDQQDATTLAELLGATRIVEELAAVQQDIAGLAIDWIEIEPESEWAGRTLADAAVHSTTSVSVVAIIEVDGTAIAAPGADDVLAPGATAVAVGTADGLEDLSRRLRRSSPSAPPRPGRPQ
jgi:TrkA domain protein